MNKLLIDIGGTNIKFGVFTNVITNKSKIPTNSESGFENIVVNIKNHIKDFYKDFNSIHISQAGIVKQDGFVLYANDNLPGFTGQSLVSVLNETFKVLVTAANDVKCSSAYAAHSLKVKDTLVITIGTGIGVSIIDENGSVVIGSNGMIGEVGQTYIDGRSLDSLLSLAKVVDKTKSIDINFDLLEFEKFLMNNEIKEIWNNYADDLAMWIRNFVFIYGKTNVLLGGNMNLLKKEYIKKLEYRVKALMPDAIAKKIIVKTIDVGNDANLLGAMILGSNNE